MKLIKIYLPSDIHQQGCKYLYGVKRVESGDDVINYFVISSAKDLIEEKDQKLLGSIGTVCKSGLSLLQNVDGKIVKVLLDGRSIPQKHRVLLLRFSKAKFLKTYDEHCEQPIEESFTLLAQILRDEHAKENGATLISKLADTSHSFLSTSASIASMALQPLVPVFKNTVIYQHCSNWRKCLRDGPSNNGFFVLDVTLGLIFLLLMNHVQTGEYFMRLTELIVNKLRVLLETLDGSPVGFKLNVQLNNFLLSCFMYHIELWWNFIVIVEPAIQYLFLPIGLFGLMGFSFQCAMLCDVITLITLHAHCFYIYAAMLYKLELSSMRSLLRIVLGRRLNVLKNRVESQNYSNRQLFLATLFFTTLLFLLPTIIIYYLVFATLRLFIYCLSYILMKIQFEILTFPFYKYSRWICGFVDSTNLTMTVASITNVDGVELCEVELTLHSCFPWKINAFSRRTKTDLTQPLNIKTFAQFLVRGEMMAFLPNI